MAVSSWNEPTRPIASAPATCWSVRCSAEYSGPLVTPEARIAYSVWQTSVVRAVSEASTLGGLPPAYSVAQLVAAIAVWAVNNASRTRQPRREKDIAYLASQGGVKKL